MNKTNTLPPGPVHATGQNPAFVLVLAPDAGFAAALRRRLTRLGLPGGAAARDAARGRAILAARRVDLLLLDIAMPDAFAVLEQLAAAGQVEETPVVIMSASPDLKPIVRALKLGAEGFLLKPFPTGLLRARVLATLEKKMLRARVREELARKQAELAQARRLQLALAPSDYRDPHVAMEVVLEPAREVGGDLVDHLKLVDGRHLFVLGDVSGKGAGAALMMARGHALVRSLTGRGYPLALLDQPSVAAGILNRELAANNLDGMFITMLLAVYNPANGQLDYVRCGHVPPFIRRRDGALERLEGARGLPLGLVEDAGYASATAWLHPGDALLILSDGITEAQAPDGALFGEARVRAWLATPPATLAPLIALVRAFEAAQPAADDISALLVNRL